MTIDTETKRYVDTMVTQLSLNLSALVTALTNTLEDKGVLTREDFEIILERTQIIKKQIDILGGTNIQQFRTSIEQLKDLAKKQDLSDLK